MQTPRYIVFCKRPAVALAAALAAGCASSGQQRPQDNPEIVAAVRADARVMGGDTTWVTRGRGYQLVALSRPDIAAFDSAIAHLSGSFEAVFSVAPPELIAVVSHVTTNRNSTTRTLPPLPTTSGEMVVELSIADRSATGPGRSERDGFRGGEYGGVYGGGYGGGYACSSGDFGPGDYRRRLCEGGYGGPGGSGERGRLAERSTDIVMRVWLSARATRVTGTAAGPGADGTSIDPRVPAWAESMLSRLSAPDSIRDRLTAQLAAQPESLYALRDFFTMSRPGVGAFADRGVAGGGAPGGRGMGGMPGTRGRENGARSGRNRSVLGGGALFDAQALVLGRYLTLRRGAPLIGKLVDAQLAGKAVGDVLATEGAAVESVELLDADWRDWLRQYAPNSGG